MKYTDIQLTNKPTWEQYKTAWGSGNYSNVIATKLTDKKLDGEVLSDISTSLISLETELLERATELKANKIQVTTTPPADITTGSVYFELAE